MKQGFAVWITGLPASGKSALTKELILRLNERGVVATVLESDAMRTLLTPEPTYSPEERDRFYRLLARIGELIVRGGGNVIFDATANSRAYRDHARALIPKFIEVFIDCPLEVCRMRDPKGIYDLALSGTASSVPGIQAAYETPLHPEVSLDCQSPPARASDAIIGKLAELGCLPL